MTCALVPHPRVAPPGRPLAVARALMCADGDAPGNAPAPGDGDAEADERRKINPALKAAADVSSLVATAVYQAVGVFFGIGLVLNLCGFGYRVKYDGIVPRVEVKRIQAMRDDIRNERWQAEFFGSDDVVKE